MFQVGKNEECEIGWQGFIQGTFFFLTKLCWVSIVLGLHLQFEKKNKPSLWLSSDAQDVTPVFTVFCKYVYQCALWYLQ